MSEAQAVEGLRLSAQQRYLWRLQQDPQAGEALRVECVVALPPQVATDAVAGALAAVAARHEILRTALRTVPGLKLPLQVPTGNGPDWRLAESAGDLPALLAAGGELLVLPERGYVAAASSSKAARSLTVPGRRARAPRSRRRLPRRGRRPLRSLPAERRLPVRYRPAMTPEPRSLTGKVVAITGGGRGIGRAIAQALTIHGARVAVCDVDKDVAEEAPAELGLEVDVTELDAFTAFLDEVEQRLGPLHILVNNAGIMPITPLVDEDPASIHRQLELNLRAVIHGTQEAMRRMVPRRTGNIVNVASLA
ncbi:MAG TPA: SDR family NAD(P)-dependent oxidoreductase, partial [Thermoanaerobaculia bacterium]|nr:SDR family NAD(P)-dependent oxidoreductase [Thermoanaerobaculia bacterium]